jgi:transcriptional regulator with XRE-family HTH domain
MVYYGPRIKAALCMLTGIQIRAARAVLQWSAAETAKRAGVERKTVERLEQVEGVPLSRTKTLGDLQQAFEAAGVEFVGTAEEGPGVRLWAPKRGKVKAKGGSIR